MGNALQEYVLRGVRNFAADRVHKNYIHFQPLSPQPSSIFNYINSSEIYGLLFASQMPPSAFLLLDSHCTPQTSPC